MSKVVSLLMSFLMVFTSFNLPVLAEGVDSPEKNITAIGELSEAVANQFVEKDATLDAINLPENLEVTVSYLGQKEIEVEVEEEMSLVAGVFDEVIAEPENPELENEENQEQNQEDNQDETEPEESGTSQDGNDENVPDSQESSESEGADAAGQSETTESTSESEPLGESESSEESAPSEPSDDSASVERNKAIPPNFDQL